MDFKNINLHIKLRKTGCNDYCSNEAKNQRNKRHK